LGLAIKAKKKTLILQSLMSMVLRLQIKIGNQMENWPKYFLVTMHQNIK